MAGSWYVRRLRILQLLREVSLCVAMAWLRLRLTAPVFVLSQPEHATVVKSVLRCTAPQAEVVDTIFATTDGALSFEDLAQALLEAGLPLSTCRRYHLRKAIVCPPVPPPVVIRRQVDSLTVTLSGFHPLYDVPVTHLVLTRDGQEVARVEEYQDFAPITVVMGGLVPGTLYSLQCCCVVRSHAFVLESKPTLAHTLRIPRPPPAPVVIERGTSSLCVSVVIPRGVELEVNGARWDAGPGEAIGDGIQKFRLRGLSPGTPYSLRCRCSDSDDAELDASLFPWSPVTDVCTMDLDAERVRYVQKCLDVLKKKKANKTKEICAGASGGGFAHVGSKSCCP